MSRGETFASRIAGPAGRPSGLPALAAELAALKVSVIVTLGNTQAVRAAKAATPSIPIVFMLGTDPVELGFVASLARPGGNLTGVFNLNQQLAQKWLEVLHEIVPAATSFALLVNPTNPATTMRYTEAMQAAAQTLGLRIHVVQASADREFDAAFANVREHRAGALAIAADALFISRVDQLAALGLHHAVPALYPFREFAAAGGLASYGTDLADTYRSAGLYTGRILNGEKPADLPVQQATKVELVLNLKTAKALGLTLPQTLIARADEVIGCAVARATRRADARCEEDHLRSLVKKASRHGSTSRTAAASSVGNGGDAVAQAGSRRRCATSAFTIGIMGWRLIASTRAWMRGSSRPLAATAMMASGTRFASPQIEPAAPAAQARPR